MPQYITFLAGRRSAGTDSVSAMFVWDVVLGYDLQKLEDFGD